MVLTIIATPLAAFAQSQDAVIPQDSAVDTGVLPPVGGVDAGELPPVAGASEAGIGFNGSVWQGTNLPDAESLLSGVTLPIRSPTLHGLWRRLLVSDGAPAAGGATAGSADPFLTRRADSFYQAGLLEETERVLSGAGPRSEVGIKLTAVRTSLALGRTDAGCGAMKSVPITSAKLSKAARTEAILLTAYCVSKDKQPQNASLAAEVARDQGVKAPLIYAVLDALAESKTAKLPKIERLGLADYKFLALLGPVAPARLVAAASADVLVAVARDAAAEPMTRVAAAEAAARVNAVTPEQLAALYVDAPVPPEIAANPLASGLEGTPQRVALFQAAASAQSPKQRLQLLAAFLAEARRDGLQVATAPVIAGLIADIPPDNSVLWFAEQAVETLIAARQYDRAMPWAVASGGGLLHWTLLIDMADPTAAVPVESALGYAEQMVQAGDLPPAVVQRLATVLDALEYNVPIGIWNAAQQAPQDTSGNLPATGQLSALQVAGTERNIARTILLTLAAYGPDTPETANLLTLGDTIRALRAAGLDADARRLGVEAMFAAWPRRAGG